MADAALDAGSVAGSALAGSARSGLVVAGELELLVGEVGECVFGRAGLEAAVADDLSRADAGMFELAGGLREQPVLARIARRMGGRQDEPAGAFAGVLAHLADLRDIPELGRLAELALADRPGVRVRERHQPVGYLQPSRTTVDLLADLLAAADELFELFGRPQLDSRATAAR